jgi:hypothetical protein
VASVARDTAFDPGAPTLGKSEAPALSEQSKFEFYRDFVPFPLVSNRRLTFTLPSFSVINRQP